MKMSNADIVLNAAERVVKCKSAHICHGCYITARVFAAVRGGFGGFFILFCGTWPFYRDVVRQWCVRGRPDGSERGFDVDKQLFVGVFFFSFFFRAQPPPRVRESLGAAALHSNTCFFTAENVPFRTDAAGSGSGPDGPVMQQDCTGSGEGGI